MKKLIKIQAVLLSAIIMLGSSASLYAGHIKSGKTPKKTSTARRLGWNKASRDRLRNALDRQEKAQQAVRRQEAAKKATQQTVWERINRTGYPRGVLGRVGESRLPVGSKTVSVRIPGESKTAVVDRSQIEAPGSLMDISLVQMPEEVTYQDPYWGAMMAMESEGRFGGFPLASLYTAWFQLGMNLPLEKANTTPKAHPLVRLKTILGDKSLALRVRAHDLLVRSRYSSGPSSGWPKFLEKLRRKNRPTQENN